MTKLLIIDNQPIFRIGLRHFLQDIASIKVIGDCSFTETAFEIVRLNKPDILIIDCSTIPEGISQLNELILAEPTIRIIALFHFSDQEEIHKVLKTNVKGILNKAGNTDEILQAIKAVTSGNEYYTKEAVKVIINRFVKGNPELQTLFRHPDFSARELEVIRLICLQKTAKEIGASLYISVKTVDYHRQKIIEKMNVSNIIGLVLFAIKNDLVKLDELIEHC